MLVVFTAKDRMALLPYFFRYYLSIGATRFLCCLQQGQNNALYETVAAWKTKLDLEIKPTGLVLPWCGPNEAFEVEHIRAGIKDPWHVIADLDEFYWLPKGTTLQDMVAKLEAGNFKAASCHLIDRIATDGSLVAPGETLDDTYPLAFNLTRAIGACFDKIAIVRTGTPLRSGHHGLADDSPVLAWGEFHHFKWLPGILALLDKRSTDLTRLGLPWAGEGWKVIDKFVDGKLNFNDPDIQTWPAPLLGI